MFWKLLEKKFLYLKYALHCSCFSFPQKVVTMNATQESGPALDQGIAFQLGKCVMELQTALKEKMKLTSLQADTAVCIRMKNIDRMIETSALTSFYVHLLSPKQY